MEELLEGRTFCAEIDEQIVFSQLDDHDSAVWSRNGFTMDLYWD